MATKDGRPRKRRRLGSSIASGVVGGRAPRGGGRAPSQRVGGFTAGVGDVILASDCTGLNTVALALASQGINAMDQWASDIDAKVRRVLSANFNVGQIFNDIMDRDDTMLPTPIDLYVAGPPCQSFSASGLNGGVSDRRGMVFLRVLKCIANVKPTAFMIENVPGLKCDP